MAVITYATVDDLSAYLGAATDSVPPDAQRLLARAQDLVDVELTKRIFVVDNLTDGNPTDAVVLNAVKRATVAQVEAWIASGDELGELDQLSSYSIEGVAVSRASADTRRRARLCDRALDALKVIPFWTTAQ